MICVFNDAATREIYTLSLHDALPICDLAQAPAPRNLTVVPSALSTSSGVSNAVVRVRISPVPEAADRKSTRLNSSHGSISYAVFCLKKKKTQHATDQHTPSREDQGTT